VLQGEGGETAFNTSRYSADEVERVAHVAFRAARARRRRVTSVDKANVLETSELWRSVVTRVGPRLPRRRARARLRGRVRDVPRDRPAPLRRPAHGEPVRRHPLGRSRDALGFARLLPSASIGGRVGLYEPVHGSAPGLAGQGVANPIGAIASAAMLLRYSAGLAREADDVETAIRSVLDAGYRTADLHAGAGRAPVTTSEMGRLVAEAVAEVADMRHPYHAV
jgi:3-isopropylmalate dehydrogenase